MSPRKLAVLDRIARMRCELELAELSRLRRIRDENARESERLADALVVARQQGCVSTADGGTAERFSRWVDLRQSALFEAMSQIDGQISVQRDRTAFAVGRQDVIETIADRQKAAALLRKARGSGNG